MSRYDELLKEGQAVYRTARPEPKPDYPRWVLDRYALCEACEATAQSEEVGQCARTATAKPCGQRRRIFEGWGCAAGHWHKKGSTALVLDWGKGPILDHIASSLQALGYRVIRQERGGAKMFTPENVKLVRQARPVLCVTRQRFYPGQPAIPGALAEVGCRTLFVDLGVWPHYDTYLVDPQGENATSSIVGRLDELEADPVARAAADAAMPQVEAMRRELLDRADKAGSRLEELGLSSLVSSTRLASGWTRHETKPFDVLILQRTGDQVLRFDAPKAVQDPVEVARQAIAAAKAAGRLLVIKPHPMDRNDVLKAIPAEGAHHLVLPAAGLGNDNDLVFAWLLASASRAIMVNSTCHYQALALGTPAACLGRGWFTGNRVVAECKNLREALAGPCPSSDDRQLRYLAHMMSRQARVAEFAKCGVIERLLRLTRCTVVSHDSALEVPR